MLTITADDIFALHRIVVGEDTRDIYRPVGAWKREDNGTYGAENGKSVYMPYATADDTPWLMDNWLKAFNKAFRVVKTQEAALDAYVFTHVSFVRIHPFFDGNGRLARLLANMPVLAAGFPPIVVPSEARLDYIRELWDYQRAVGVVSRANRELLPEPSRLDNLRRLVKDWWQTTLDKDGIVRVSDAEIARIAAFLGMDEAEFIERETEVAPDRKGLVLKSCPDGSCAYLTEDNLCRINPVKPEKCRTFPFEWTNPDSAEVCPGLAEGMASALPS